MRIIGKFEGRTSIELVFKNRKLTDYNSEYILREDFDYYFKESHMTDGKWALAPYSPENACYVLSKYFLLDVEGDVPEPPNEDGVIY